MYVIHILLLLWNLKYVQCSDYATRSNLSGFLASRFEAEEKQRGGLWVDINDKTSDEQSYDDGSYEDDEFEDSRLSIYEEIKPLKDSMKSRNKNNNEHPMRTDEWLISVSLSPFVIARRREMLLFPISCSHLKKRGRQMDQYFKFAKNGYVLMVESDVTNENEHVRSHQQITRVGKWNLGPHGISWTISVGSLRTCLHYHADIHLSKFQERPRMFRGVVTRDRYVGAKIPFTNISVHKYWFRPVIATFVGLGIGTDTADVSYKKRGFGLSGGNA